VRRYATQRRNRARLKADTHYLLRRILFEAPDLLSTKLGNEIVEMQMRLQPDTGKKAPIILTGYTK
jgi:hypothetical protein